MSDLRASRAEPYSFPRMSTLGESQLASDRARQAQLQAALNDAVAEGLAEGLAQGRIEAQLEARQMLETSRQEGLDRGHREGLDEMLQAAAVLREALAQFELQRAELVSSAEGFCVELALAIVARLVETDEVRAEFVLRCVRSGLAALAPETPTAIFLHPKVRQHLARAIDDLPVREDDKLEPGSARVETGRLLVESSIDAAFAQIRSAIVELATSRRASLHEVAGKSNGGGDASDR